MKNILTLLREIGRRLIPHKIFPGFCILAALLLFGAATVSAKAHPESISFGTAPIDQTVCAGSPATFTVGATGSGVLTYQWQVSTNGGSTWAPISDGAVYTGTSTMTLRITATTLTLNNNRYRCVVSDGTPANSAMAKLTVNAGTGPVPPMNVNISLYQCDVAVGSSTTNNLTAFSYQWQVSTDGLSWTNLADDDVYSGSTGPVLQWDGNMAKAESVPLNGNLYRYTMTNTGSGCSTISAIDTLHTVTTPPVLIPTPLTASICTGSVNNSTTFALLSGTSGYTFTWQASSDNGANYSDLSDNSNYTGSLTTSLGLTGITVPMKYRARTTLTTPNVTCESFSAATTLTMKALPAITIQPNDAFVCANTSPKLAVTATGAATLTYQWQSDNGTNGSTWTNVTTGATAPTTRQVTLNSVTTAMDGYKYKVLIGGPCSVTGPVSNIVTLHIGNSGTWLGTLDTDWHHDGNWCSIAPVQTTDVLVPSWAPRMPVISDATVTAYSRSLTIQSGASLTVSGGTLSMTGPFSIPGTVSYTGITDQQMLPADYGTLNVSGSGNKFMQLDAAISNNLGLAGTAKLVTGSHILTMKAGSNPINRSGSGTWIVTGNGSSGSANTGLGGLKMAQLSATATNILFPVGPTSAVYNPLFLTNSGVTNDFTVAVNDQNIPGGPLGAVVDRTWLVAAANPGSTISLGLQWNAAEEPATFDRSNAAVIRSNGASIVQKGSVGAASGPNPYSLAGGSFSTITQFSVGTNTMIVLPLRLLFFSATWINNSSAGLSWTMDPQARAQSYTIQRAADGGTFTDIGKVMAGAADGNYSFIDPRPGTDNKYRLRLVSPDGDMSYSSIVQLSGEAKADRIVLAPSVTEQSTTRLLVSLGHPSDLSWIMTDVSGHTVSRNAVRLTSGEHYLPLDLGSLTTGIYFIKVTGTGGIDRTLTLIKK